MFNIFSSNKIFTCSKHNYTGINSSCPDCGLVEAGVMQKITDLEEKYNELIYAVATKYPNETRHQTALKYIKNAENEKLIAGLTNKSNFSV